MTDDTILPFSFPAVHAKKVTADITKRHQRPILHRQVLDPQAFFLAAAMWLFRRFHPADPDFVLV
jgi:hypothetical protein